MNNKNNRDNDDKSKEVTTLNAPIESAEKSRRVTTLDSPIKETGLRDKKVAAATSTAAPKTIYTKVTLDGEEEPGILVLTASGLVYHSGSQEGRRVQIAWSNVVAKHLLNAADRPQALVKVIHKQGSAYTFQMKDSSDQRHVIQDMDKRLKAHWEHHQLSSSACLVEPAHLALAGAHDASTNTSHTDPSTTVHDSSTTSSCGSQRDEKLKPRRESDKRPVSPTKVPSIGRNVNFNALDADASTKSTPFRTNTGSHSMVQFNETVQEEPGSPSGRASSPDGYFILGEPLPGAYHDNNPPVCAPPLSSTPLADGANDSDSESWIEDAAAGGTLLVSAVLVPGESLMSVDSEPVPADPIRMEHELQDGDGNTDDNKVAGDSKETPRIFRIRYLTSCGLVIVIAVVVLVVVIVIATRGKNSSRDQEMAMPDLPTLIPSPAPTLAPSPPPSPAPLLLGDWEFCSSSSQCSNGCCSNEYSDDGELKCTPLNGGFDANICVVPALLPLMHVPPTMGPSQQIPTIAPSPLRSAAPTHAPTAAPTLSPTTAHPSQSPTCFSSVAVAGNFTYDHGIWDGPVTSDYFSNYDDITMNVIEQYIQDEVDGDFGPWNPKVTGDVLFSTTRSVDCWSCNGSYLILYDFQFFVEVSFDDCGPAIPILDIVVGYDYGDLYYLTNQAFYPTYNDTMWSWFPFEDGYGNWSTYYVPV